MSAATALLTLGINVKIHGHTGQRLPCPRCGKGPKDDAMGVNIETGAFHCFRCGWAGRAVDDTEKRDNEQRKQYTSLSEWGRALWRECRPIDGVARQYLEARRCYLPPEDSDLRWHPNLKHPGGYIGAALVGLVTHAITNEPLTLHRTWIRADGRKAELDKPRLLLGGHTKRGGVIRLWPDDCVNYGLAVSEGVETALAAAHLHRPIWSAIDAGNLAALPVLPAVECLTIYADHDDAGIAAARTLGRRWRAAGRDVVAYRSPVPGEDIADLVARRAS